MFSNKTKQNKKMKLLSIFFLFFLSLTIVPAVVFSQTTPTPTPRNADTNYVMPWLCTERCNQTTAQVMQNIQSVIDHQFLLSRVCFERYNLGPNATLIVNTDLTNPNPIFKQKAPQLKTLAMISSYPYPKSFLDWMRSVFQNAVPFLNTVLQHLNQDNIDGVNIDWEPTTEATSQDAADYATFLGVAHDFFSLHGKIMSVDVAGWSTIWNMTEISAALSKNLPNQNDNNKRSSSSSSSSSLLPMMCTMSTYVNTDSVWLEQLESAVNQIQNYRQLLVVGLEVFPQTNVAFRFDHLKKRGLCRAAIWDLPMNTTWWNALGDYVRNCQPGN